MNAAALLQVSGQEFGPLARAASPLLTGPIGSSIADRLIPLTQEMRHEIMFIAGKGAHYEGDIKAHTKTVLDEIKAELENAGSSMEKVLKAQGAYLG